MNRRRLLAIIAASPLAVGPLAALAQGRRPLIAWLGTATHELQAHFIDSFVKGMAELGRIEGRDYEIVYRFAAGQLDRLPALAEELVKLNPTIILSGSTPGTIAARAATATIPIVAPTFSDPAGR